MLNKFRVVKGSKVARNGARKHTAATSPVPFSLNLAENVVECLYNGYTPVLYRVAV